MAHISGLRPRVGEWYRRQDRPQPFHVVAVDEDSGTVDIEYFDGTIDEWPADHWAALEIEPCGAPQDWSGPFDDVRPDDLDADAEHMTAESGALLERVFGRDALELEPPEER